MKTCRIPLSPVVDTLLVGVLVFVTFVLLTWLPYPVEGTSDGRLEGFSAARLLGTGRLDCDLASHMMVGVRIVFVVGLGTVAAVNLIGVNVGLVIALARSWVGNVASATLNALIVFSTPLLAMLIVAGFDASLATATVAIGVAASAVVTRLTCVPTRRVLAEQYVLTAHTSGMSTWGVLTRHVLPNIWPTLATSLAVTVGGVALVEAGLFYLGLSAPPPNTSWGRPLQDTQVAFTTRPLGATTPGLAIIAFAPGANLTADSLRPPVGPTQGDAK